MARLQDGDDAAVAELMVRWEVPVKAFLRRVGVTAADVEDVAQDTFVRLYQKRASYRRGAPLKAWLLTLAVNLGRSRLRWRWRRPETELDEVALDTTAGSEADGAQSTEQAERARAVRAAVQQLRRSWREVVVCVEYEGLSHAEAATVLGCSPKAVETRLRRAREALRASLASWLA